MALAKKFTASAAFLLVLLAAGLQAQPAYAEDDMTATFTYPVDKGLSFYDNIDVVVRYECSVDAVDLRIYCNNADTKEIDEGTAPYHAFTRSTSAY